MEDSITLRRTPRRKQQQAVDVTPALSRAKSTARKSDIPKNKTTVGKSVKKVGTSKSRAPEVSHDVADENSTTLVNDSIEALDFDISIPLRSSTSTGKRKRHSTGSTSTTPKRARHQSNSNNNSPSIVHVLSLRRQILDPRITRRIRRNGLSEEMNAIYDEKRTRRRTEEELRLMREELDSKDDEIERLREMTQLSDGDASRVRELEREVKGLREELGNQSPNVQSRLDADDQWDMPGGFSDRGSDVGGMDSGDDHQFGDSTVAELEFSSTPENSMRTTLHVPGSALTPPGSSSPTKSATPAPDHLRGHIRTDSTASTVTSPHAVETVHPSGVGTQTFIHDVEKAALRDQLTTLRSDLTAANGTLKALEELQTRVKEKLLGSVSDGSSLDVDLQLDIVLQNLSEKTASLHALSLLLSSSSSSSDSKEMTAKIAKTLRSIRLGLEDLLPGEALPYGSLELLDFTAQRLHEMGSKVKDLESALDCSQQTEVKLRQQLNDRVDAMDSITQMMREKDDIINERDSRISNLELDTALLNGTIAALQILLSQLRDSEAALQGQVSESKDAVLQKDATLAETEERLAGVLAQITTLKHQLVDKHTTMVERDGELASLRGEVDRLDTALVKAQETMSSLRDDGARDKAAAQNAVGTMREQLLQALIVGEGFLGMPSPASTAPEAVPIKEQNSVAVVEDQAVPSAEELRKRRGRMYDSGVRFLEEDSELK